MSRAPSSGPPTSSRPAFLRPRLLEVLQQRFGRRVVAVVAGAGFGKSTLIGQAITENRLSGQGRDVWIGCVGDHSAASVLVEDLLTGLGVRLPVDVPTDPAAGARLIADAVWGLAPEEVALVIDDVQVLPAASAGQRLVAELIDVLPGNGHLVLASRPPLPFPMSRLLGNGTGLLLQESDLAFADAELGQFAGSRGVPVDLLDGISGWPALAELIATTGRRQVADYLWEEVLRGLSPQRRTVLAVLAEVGSADDALMSELIGREVDLATELGDLPLIFWTENRWSLHPLWQNTLRAGSGSGTGAGTADGEVAAAVAAAPAALRRRGMLRQGMRLLIDGEAWPQVERLIVEACYGITPAVPVDVLSDWQVRLPESVRTSPAGLLLAGTADTDRHPELARERLERAAAGFRSAGDVTGEMACLVSLYHIAFGHNEIAATRPIIARWQELADTGVVDAAQTASLGRALLADRPAVASRELARLTAQSSGPVAVLVDWVRAHLLALTLGEPERAVTWAQEALPLAPPTLRSSIRCELVEGLRLLGRSTQAAEQADLLIAEQTSAVVRSPRHIVVATVLHAFCGEVDRARELLPQLHEVAVSSALPWAELADLVGRAAVEAGQDDDAAAALIAELGDHPMALPLVLLRISPAALPLQYVLAPDSRPGWDRMELLGVLDTARRLARAVAALREGSGSEVVDEVSAGELRDVVGTLPTGWLAMLAVALSDRGRDEGTQLVQRLGPSARPALRRVEDQGGAGAPAARRLLALVPSVPRHALSIDILGPLTVRRDGEEVDDANLRRARVRQLLGYLVVHRQASRHQLTTALWPDLDEPDAARNLRVTLNYLQRLLEPARDERDAPFFLRAKASLLELTDDPRFEIDLRAFERDLDDADLAEQQGAPSLALAAYLRAAARYRGDLLADQPGDGWLDLERTRLRRRYLRAVLRAGHLLLASGEPGRAEDLALGALAADPWSEEAYRILVAALIGQDERAAAVRTLDRMFEMLADLQVPASPAAFELARQLRHGAVTGSA